MKNHNGRSLSRVINISLLIIAFSAAGFAVDKKTALDVEKEIEKITPEIIKIRRYLHMNPELGNREFETAKFISAKLNSLGLEVKTQVAKTGVIGLLRGSHRGPTIAVRADMDALPLQEMTSVTYKSLNPGVMHACGHDIHVSIVLGTAYVLSTMKDRVKGNIKFIFQPAEEGPPPGEEGGASLMVKEGVLEDPPVGAILGLHVWPENVGEVYFAPGILMANSDSFRIVVKGKSSHGARPQEGIDAIFLASQIVVTLQSAISRAIDPMDPAVLTIGKIEGGKRTNIIAEQTTLEGTIRTLSDINRKKILRLLEDIVKGITQSFGGSYTLTFTERIPAVDNHPELAKILLPSIISLLGKEKVKDIKPQLVAEDFSYFSQKIPGFYFFLGVKNPQLADSPPLHSPYFNPDERSIPLGIKIMTRLLLDCLDQQVNLETSPSPF